MLASRPRALSVWLMASIFYAYQNVLRVMPNVMLSDTMRQFNIDAALFGQLSGVYYIGYALMHIPVGLMLDRVGPKKVLPACILLTVVGLTPILYADHWMYAIVGRMLLGMGSSAAILGTFHVIRTVFDEHHFSKMLGFAVLIGLLGSVYGGGPLSYACNTIGYKAIVEIAAIAGILLALITYVVTPAFPSTASGDIKGDLKEVFTNGRVIMLCLSAGLMVGPMEGFADVWGAAFLKQVYGLDITSASTLTSMIFIGMCAGAPLIPILADTLRGHLGVIMGAGIMMMLAFIGLLSGWFSPLHMTVVFFIIGACCAYQVIVVYKTSTYVPAHVVGLTTAVTNMIIMSFGYAFHSLIGGVVHACGGAHLSSSFTYGLGVIPCTLLLGVLGCMAVGNMEKRALKPV